MSKLIMTILILILIIYILIIIRSVRKVQPFVRRVEPFLISVIFLFGFCQPIYANLEISEFSSHSSPEWVEIYNDSDEKVSLEGFKIVDDKNNDLSLDTCINPNSFRFFEKTNWLNNDKDSVSLLDADNNTIDGPIVYGEGEISAPNANQSLEKDQDGNWAIEDNPNPIDDVCSPDPSPTNTLTPEPPDYEIYLNELMPDPVDSDEALKPDGEWIEVYNPNKVDLMGFVLQDEAGHNLLVSSDNSEKYDSGAYWVIYRSGCNFSLNNTGDSLILSKDDYQIDDMVYDETKVGKSWAKIDGDWCLADPSKGSSNGGCWSEDDKNNSLSNTPTPIKTPTPKIIISPGASPTSKAKVLSASDSAEASNSASGSAFFDLWKRDKDKKDGSSSENTWKQGIIGLIPWIFTLIGSILSFGLAIYYFWKKKKNN